MILDVCLEMTGQVIDACGQQRNLHFGGTRVALGTLVIGNDLAPCRQWKLPLWFLLLILWCWATWRTSDYSVSNAGIIKHCRRKLSFSRRRQAQRLQPAVRDMPANPDEAVFRSINRAAGTLPSPNQRTVWPCLNRAASARFQPGFAPDPPAKHRAAAAKHRGPRPSDASSMSREWAWATSSTPIPVRRKAARCAPQPRRSPMSAARVRT